MADGSIETENAELLTLRDFQRGFSRQVERLVSGEVEKLVLLRRNQMVAVVLPLERYVELLNEKRKVGKMEIKFLRIEDGPGRVEVRNPSTGEVVATRDVNVGEAVTLTVLSANGPEDIQVGEVAASPYAQVEAPSTDAEEAPQGGSPEAEQADPGDPPPPQQ